MRRIFVFIQVIFKNKNFDREVVMRNIKNTLQIVVLGILISSCSGGGNGGSGVENGSGNSSPLLPEIPQNISAISNVGRISLSWDASNNTSLYKVYWNTVGSVSKSDNVLQATSTNIEHTQLISGTKYYYRVAAINDEDESDLSTEISVASVPTDSIASFYPFNGNANDETGNNNTGSVHGAVLTSDRFGNENGAYYFDGINDYLSFGAVSPLSDHSVSVWVKPEAQIQYATIVGHEGGPSEACGKGFVIRINTSLNPYYVLDPAGCGGVGGTVVLDSDSSIEQDAWSHIVGTYDGDNALLYVNGDLIAQKSGATFDASTWLAIGATSYFNGQQALYKGSIDDVRIYYNILSEVEVKALFNEGKTIVP